MLFDLVPTPEEVVTGEAWGPRTSWLVAFLTGRKIFRQGTHNLLDVAVLALRWKMWASVALWWGAIWVLGTAGSVLLAAQPMEKGGQYLFLAFIVALNTAVVYFAMGVVFVRLCIQSAFSIPRLFRPCRRLAVWTPNVKPVWWYLAPFLPCLWGLTLIFFVLGATTGWWWNYHAA